MLAEFDLELGDARILHVYDTGMDGGDSSLVVFWHHGTPNTGDPPAPLSAAAARHGIRWVSYDRPGYGGSTPRPGRDVASAAADISGIADALGIGQFAVMGHSSGGTYALAGAALLPARVLTAVCVSAVAPFGADGLDWFAGMAAPGTLRAAVRGRVAVEEHLASTDFDPEEFTPADHAALSGEWSWLGDVAGKALAGGRSGEVADELALVAPWGFDPRRVTVPVLFLHGGRDRIAPRAHGTWLARQIRSAELWLRPDDGHISVLNSGAAALDWLRENASLG